MGYVECQQVDEHAPVEKKAGGTDGIAGALARALASRKDAIADTGMYYMYTHYQLCGSFYRLI